MGRIEGTWSAEIEFLHTTALVGARACICEPGWCLNTSDESVSADVFVGDVA